MADNLDDSLDDDLDENLNDDLSDDEEPEPKDTSLEIISQDDWKIYGNEDYYVKLVDEDDNPISDALIYFRIEDPEGVYTFETAYTGEDGIAILSLDLSIRGIHNIQVSYDGDLNYNPAESVYSNVILYEMTDIQTLKSYAYRSSDFTIKLVDSNGNLAIALTISLTILLTTMISALIISIEDDKTQLTGPNIEFSGPEFSLSGKDFKDKKLSFISLDAYF